MNRDSFSKRCQLTEWLIHNNDSIIFGIFTTTKFGRNFLNYLNVIKIILSVNKILLLCFNLKVIVENVMMLVAQLVTKTLRWVD